MAAQKAKKDKMMSPADKKERDRRERALAVLAGKDFEDVDNAAEGATSVAPGGVVDKEALIDVPLIIVDLKRNQGDLGPWGLFTVKVDSGEVVKFTDSGCGILPAVEGMQPDPEKPKTWIKVPGGLRVSKYEGPAGPAETYYLNGGIPVLGKKKQAEVTEGARKNGRGRASASA